MKQRAAPLILALIAAVLVSCDEPPPVEQPQAPGPQPQAGGPVFLNHDTDVAYVGAQACLPCHFEIASTYAHTGMGRAFYPMSAEQEVEDFQDRNQVDLPEAGLRYTMLKKDGRYYQRQSVIDGDAGEMAVDEREMIYVLGSGNNNRSYVTVEDGKLLQMPICWYPHEELWDLCPGYEIENDHFTRPVGTSCIFCHNGRMELVAGTKSQYREPIPMGIGCERCHGPGELHVEHWKSGDSVPTGNLDPTIVNPRRLPAEQRIQVCYQCHLGDIFVTQLIVRSPEEQWDWRPGRPIQEAAVHLRLATPSQSEFGITAQADRLMLSRCFQESNGRMECLTCHNPHVTVYREDRPDDFFTSKCLTCHELETCRAHDQQRQTTTPPDNCVACHMRKAKPDDVQHTTVTDHWIRRNIDVEALKDHASGEFVPVLPEDFETLSAGEQAYYKGRAYLQSSTVTIGETRGERRRLAETWFNKAIAAGFDTADIWFRLGFNHAFAQRWEEATEALQKAVQRDPQHHEANIKLAEALVALNRLQEAAAIYEKMLQDNPQDTAALAELGRLQLAFQDPDLALGLFDRAVTQEPWTASLHANRGMTLAGLGKNQAALQALEKAAALDPEDAPIWSYYSQLLAAMGKAGEASAARRHAQLLAEQRRKREPGGMPAMGGP